MATPILELIALDVTQTVASVTVANGYAQTLSVSRHSRGGDKRLHLSAVIVQEDPREASDPKVYFSKEWWQPFHVGVFVVPDESDATPIDTYCNQIRSDVEKALMVDPYRGGHALDTQIRASHIISSDALEYDLIVIVAEVNYRTRDTDPTAPV